MMSLSQHPAALQARVNKLLSSRAEVESTKALLSTLVASEPSLPATAPSSSTTAIVTMDASSSLADLRKNLRASLEEKQLALAESALQGLAQTLGKVTQLRASVEALDTKCTRIQRFLDATKRETQQVQADAAQLADKKARLQRELDDVRAFLSRYELSEAEAQQLNVANLRDDHMRAFLDAMERVQHVKRECRALVATDDVACALELLDAVGKHQERGFARLYEWTSAKCTAMDSEPSALLHRAIALLRDRPEFYTYCKECVTAARRSVLVRRFVTALTRGGPNGIPRPIELHAHDAVRYIGDMLAWVHQALATELEFFRVLFENDLTSVTTDSDQPVDEASPSTSASPSSLVGNAFDGVARPLESRIEQTLGASSHSLATTFRLVLLLAFYDATLATFAGDASTLSRSLAHCRGVAYNTFTQQLLQLAEALAAATPEYASDVAATPTTLETAQRLSELIRVAHTSLLPPAAAESDVAPLFDAVLPALERLCVRSAESFVDASDALVFRINNCSGLIAPLAHVADAKPWLERVAADIDAAVEALSDRESQRVLDRYGVTAVLTRIRDIEMAEGAAETAAGESGVETDGLDVASVATAMNGLCDALVTLALPPIAQLAQPDLRDRARQRTALHLANAFARVHAFVSAPARDFRARGLVLMHTPQEVRAMLELDD